MIKSISDIMYKFIWNGKPDKVNRQQICKDYLDGGFKMIDLEKYIISLNLDKMSNKRFRFTMGISGQPSVESFK